MRMHSMVLGWWYNSVMWVHLDTAITYTPLNWNNYSKFVCLWCFFGAHIVCSYAKLLNHLYAIETDLPLKFCFFFCMNVCGCGCFGFVDIYWCANHIHNTAHTTFYTLHWHFDTHKRQKHGPLLSWQSVRWCCLLLSSAFRFWHRKIWKHVCHINFTMSVMCVCGMVCKWIH